MANGRTLVNITRMGPTAKALEKCATNLDRIAYALEVILAQTYNIYVTPQEPDTKGREPEAIYTDEQADVLREFKEMYGKQAGKMMQEEEEEDVLRADYRT